MFRSIIALVLIVATSAGYCADSGKADLPAPVSTACGAGMATCQTFSTAFAGGAITSGTECRPSSGCVASSTEETERWASYAGIDTRNENVPPFSDGDIQATISACDGDAETPSTDCMVMLISSVL
jgi:hypothetical protein